MNILTFIQNNKIYLLLVFLLCSNSLPILAQNPCMSIGTITSQAALDQLGAPGGRLDGVSCLSGLFIGESNKDSDITDLSPLRNITRISGFVTIRETRLTNLNGLTQLQRVERDFSVKGNPNMSSLGHFSSLQNIEGNFRVTENQSLQYLGSFPALDKITGSFVVHNNNKLQSLGVFASLDSIGKQFKVTGNDLLESLGSFSTLKSIGEEENKSIIIRDSPLLNYCCALANFLSEDNHTIAGELSIEDAICYQANEFNCTSVFRAPTYLDTRQAYTRKSFSILSTGRWKLSKIPSDEDWISTFSVGGDTLNSSSITWEGDGYVTLTHPNNPNHTSRTAKFLLTAIDTTGNESTTSDPFTITLNQFGTRHNGSITLSTQEDVNRLNNTLTNNATYIAGNLVIKNSNSTDDHITDISPLRHITNVSGNVRIESTQLKNLQDLSQLQTIGGNFLVQSNNEMKFLGSFSSLQTIGGNFHVILNSKMEFLGNFPSLNNIEEEILVQGNAKLQSLGYFSSVTNIGITERTKRSFVAQNNSSLKYCCNLPEMASGAIILQNNTSSCNSVSARNCNPLLKLLAPQNTNIIVDKTNTEIQLQILSTGRWRLSKPSGADWITSFSLGSKRINNQDSIIQIGDNVIDVIYETNPNEEVRTAILTLTAIDEMGNALNSLEPINVTLTQLGSTHDGDVEVTTQEEVDQFMLTPYATSIRGNVTIGPSSGNHSDITDLSLLDSITHVLGNIIVQNTQLDNLNHLTRLKIVDGDFIIRNNPTLQQIGNFSRLKSIANNFEISGNGILTQTGDFAILKSVGGGYVLSGNNAIVNIGDFPSLQHIKGNISLVDNSKLSYCCNFPIAIMQNASALEIRDNAPGCTHLAPSDDFNQIPNDITCLVGDIHMSTQNQVDNIPLSVTNIAGKLIIRGNPSNTLTEEISHLNSLSHVSEVFGIEVQSTRMLRSLSHVNAEGELEGLHSLRTIYGDFIVGEMNTTNDRLDSLGIFNQLEDIKGDFLVQNNGMNFRKLGSFPRLDTIYGYMDIQNNDSLNALGNFSTLAWIGDYFSIKENDMLTDMNDFNSLELIESDFIIEENDVLENTGNFPRLTSVGKFVIKDNSKLTSLGNLYALRNIRDELTIQNNPMLSSCCGLSSSTIGNFTKTGDTTNIANNADGCQTEDDIISCASILEIESNAIITHSSSKESTFNIISDVFWRLTLTSSSPWITGITTGTDVAKDNLEIIEKNGDATVTIRYNANNGEEKRMATFTINALDTIGGNPINSPTPIALTLTQEATPSLSIVGGGDVNVSEVNSSEYTTNLSVKNQTVNLSIRIGGSSMGWTVTKTSDTANFVSLSNNISMNQDGILTLSIAQNDQPIQRSATLTFRTMGGSGGADVIQTLVIIQAGQPTLTITSTSIHPGIHTTYLANLNSMSQTINLSINVGGSVTGWTITEDSDDDEIASVSTPSGSMSEEVTITITQNISAMNRTANFTIATTGESGSNKSQTLMITQLPANVDLPVLTISNDDPTAAIQQSLSNPINHTVRVGSSSQHFRVNVDIGGGATGWMVNEIIDEENFIEFFSASMGNSDGVVSITINENTDDIRTASIRFNTTSISNIAATQVLEIIQTAGPSILKINSNEVDILKDINDNYTLDLDNTNQQFDLIVDVGGSVMEWEVNKTHADNFVNLSTSMGEDNDTLTMTIDKNIDAKRRDTLTFTTIEATNDPIIQKLIITQEAGPNTLLLSSANVTLKSTPTTDTVNVDASNQIINIAIDIGGGATEWTVTENDVENFVDIPTTTGSDNDTLKITIDTNVERKRKATFSFTTGGEDLATRTLVVIQEAGPSDINITTDPIEAIRDTIKVDNSQQKLAFTIDVKGSATGWRVSKIDLNTFIDLPKTMDNDSTTLEIMINTNNDAKRNASLTFTTTGEIDNPVSKTIIVTQEAGPNTLLLSSTNVTLESTPTTDTVNVNASNQTVNIAIDIRGGATEWTVTENDTENFVDMPTTTGRDNDTLKITIDTNTEKKRTATFSFTTTGTDDPAARTLVVTQEAGPSDINITTDPIDAIRDTIKVDNSQQKLAFSIDVKGSATGWKVSKIDLNNFIDLPKTMDNDSTTLDIMINTNNNAKRNASLTFTTTGETDNPVSKTIIVTQEAGPTDIDIVSASVAIVNDTVNIDNQQQKLTFTIDVKGSATNWSVNKSDPNNFITLPNTIIGDDNGILEIMASTNNNAKRNASLTLTTIGETDDQASHTLIVTQEAGPATLSIIIPTIQINNGIVNVHASNQRLVVNIDIEGSAIGWEVNKTNDNETFIALSNTRGSKDGTLLISINDNASSTQRSATLTFTTTGGSGVDSQKIIITQEASPSLIISGKDIRSASRQASSDYTVEVTPSQQNLVISIGIGGSAGKWIVEKRGDNENFITLPRTTTGKEDGTLNVTIDANNTIQERNASLIFSVTGSTIKKTKTLLITQIGLSSPTIDLSIPDANTNDINTTYSINVNAMSQNLTLNINIGGSAMGWEIIKDVDEKDFTDLPNAATGDNNAILLFKIEENNTTIERSSSRVITTKGGVGFATKILVINQEAGTEPPLSILRQPSLTLYPNPANNILTIQGKNGQLQISIHNLVGKEIFSYSLSEKEKTIDISEILSGMYVVTLESKAEKTTKILIKK